MSEQDTAWQYQGDDPAHSEFYRSVVACMRVLSEDASLSVSIGTPQKIENDFGNHDEQPDVYLPLIADQTNTSLVALIRGLGDSYAMMRRFHDSEFHNRVAPQDSAADRLFTLLERERFEALGSRRYPGVAANLAQVWTLSHTREALERFGGSEQLEFVLSCLCREHLSEQDLSTPVERFLKPIRGPVDDLIAAKLQGLGELVDSQHRFAARALEIIACLGFDTSARESLQSAVAVKTEEEANDNRHSEDELHDDAGPIDEEPNSDETTQEESAPTDEFETNDDDSATDEKTELVRNAENELDSEPEQLNDAAIAETVMAEQTSFCLSTESVAAYSVFDRSSDEVCSAASLTDAVKMKKLRRLLDTHVSRYQPLVGQLASRLQQVLLSRQQRSWEQDRDEGELDTQRLTRIVVNPMSTLNYRIESNTAVRDTAVSLLIDNSRSMFGKPIVTAASCADLITRMLERCGVRTEVLGFTTVTMYGGSAVEKWQEHGCPEHAGRLNSVRHIIYKPATASWQKSRDNFGLMLDKDLLKQNIDGEALLWARKRLLLRPEGRRILMVISDGRPSDSYTLKANHKQYLHDHLDQAISQIERRAEIELIAIGIGHQVSNHYRRSFYLRDVEQLGPLMLSELDRLLRR